MKTILYLAGLTVILATTGCVVPVRERTYVQRREYRHDYYPRHHWEHRGVVPEYRYYYREY